MNLHVPARRREHFQRAAEEHRKTELRAIARVLAQLLGPRTRELGQFSGSRACIGLVHNPCKPASVDGSGRSLLKAIGKGRMSSSENDSRAGRSLSSFLALDLQALSRRRIWKMLRPAGKSCHGGGKPSKMGGFVEGPAKQQDLRSDPRPCSCRQAR